MKVEAAALVHGTTVWCDSEYPRPRPGAISAAARLTMNSQSWGTVTDVVYASGDANADDEGVHNFKMDINYEMGMMLYRSILAAQSARRPSMRATRSGGISGTKSGEDSHPGRPDEFHGRVSAALVPGNGWSGTVRRPLLAFAEVPR